MEHFQWKSHDVVEGGSAQHPHCIPAVHVVSGDNLQQCRFTYTTAPTLIVVFANNLNLTAERRPAGNADLRTDK